MSSVTPVAGVRGRLGEVIFAGLALALGVSTLLGAFSIHVPVGSRVGPTAFPVLVSVILMVSAAAVLIGVLRGHVGEAEQGEDVDLSRRTDWLTLVKIVVFVVAHLLLINLIGWAPAAAILFAGVAWTLGAKRWWAALLGGAAIALVIQIVFGELLGLSLPLGPALEWIRPLIP